jgi:hypothetical protein
MYLLLLVFGVLLGAAGILLAASGLSLREGSFDAGLFTPGIVSTVGGLLLIGLGLALRTLQRIERALAARAMPRVARGGEFAEAGETSDHSGDPGFLPLPTQASPLHHSATAATRLGVEQPASGAVEKSLETARVGDRSFPPLPNIAASAANEANAETDTGRFGKQGNGAAAARISPRLPIGARSSAQTERPKAPAFDALWPKGSRPMRITQPVPTQTAAAPAIEPQQNAEQTPETTADTVAQGWVAQSAVAQGAVTQGAVAQGAAAQDAVAQGAVTQGAVAQDAVTQDAVTQDAVTQGAAQPVSVLKSGVVDGMTYTLYSDGSIEAQLPQGTLRFGSITELRHHIEQSA